MRKHFISFSMLFLAIAVDLSAVRYTGGMLHGQSVELRLHPKIAYAIPDTDLGFIPYLPPGTECKGLSFKREDGSIYLLVHVNKLGIARAVHLLDDKTYVVNYDTGETGKIIFDDPQALTVLKMGTPNKQSHGRLLYTQSELTKMLKNNLVVGNPISD